MLSSDIQTVSAPYWRFVCGPPSGRDSLAMSLSASARIEAHCDSVALLGDDGKSPPPEREWQSTI